MNTKRILRLVLTLAAAVGAVSGQQRGLGLLRFADTGYDRRWRTPDGEVYRGIDVGDGTTQWYGRDGDEAGVTDTPSEDEQEENEQYDRDYDRCCPACGGTGRDPLDGGQCDECDGLGVRWEDA